MGAMTKKLESMSAHAFSQFELTTQTVTKLNGFNLTPTAKLVLLYLTTCYNPKHNEVFPKQKKIADKLGISERSVTRAIQELFKEGLVLIECKYTNRYKFTSKIVNLPLRRNEDNLYSDNMTDDFGQNDILKRDNLSHLVHEQIKEEKKEPIKDDDFKILKEYAQKNCTSTPEKYLNWILKHKDAQKKILSDHRKEKNAKQRALRNIEESQEILRRFDEYKKDTALPSECEQWKELGKKIRTYNNHKCVTF